MESTVLVWSLITATAERASQESILSMVIHAGWIVKGVLLILLAFSSITWAIIVYKIRLISRTVKEGEAFLEFFWRSKSLSMAYKGGRRFRTSPFYQIFRAGYSELIKLYKDKEHLSRLTNPVLTPAMISSIKRTLEKSVKEQVANLTDKLSFLATTGNTAPFIGLFGTVWGIMDSFHGIGQRGSASLAVVAPGISEALVATAAGLAAAIPAVVAYNYFLNRISRIEEEMNGFVSDFINLLERGGIEKENSQDFRGV